jgi:hypothetical protein
MTDLLTLAETLLANFRTIPIPPDDQPRQPSPSAPDWLQVAKPGWPVGGQPTPVATGFAANWSPTGTTGFSTIWSLIPWEDGDYTFSLPTPARCPYLRGLPMAKLAPVSPWTLTLKHSSRRA